jgi:hypothetical protein
LYTVIFLYNHGNSFKIILTEIITIIIDSSAQDRIKINLLEEQIDLLTAKVEENKTKEYNDEIKDLVSTALKNSGNVFARSHINPTNNSRTNSANSTGKFRNEYLYLNNFLQIYESICIPISSRFNKSQIVS